MADDQPRPVESMDIRCLSCGTWFGSPVQIGDFRGWDSIVMVGNVTRCPNGHATDCNRENMRIRLKDGGFLGDATG